LWSRLPGFYDHGYGGESAIDREKRIFELYKSYR
jgi:hypothetical protein